MPLCLDNCWQRFVLKTWSMCVCSGLNLLIRSRSEEWKIWRPQGFLLCCYVWSINFVDDHKKHWLENKVISWTWPTGGQVFIVCRSPIRWQINKRSCKGFRVSKGKPTVTGHNTELGPVFKLLCSMWPQFITPQLFFFSPFISGRRKVWLLV